MHFLLRIFVVLPPLEKHFKQNYTFKAKMVHSSHFDDRIGAQHK